MNQAKRNKWQKRLWRTVMLLILLLFWVGIIYGADEVVSKITVLGNAKVEEGVIRERSRVGKKDPSRSTRCAKISDRFSP